MSNNKILEKWISASLLGGAPCTWTLCRLWGAIKIEGQKDNLVGRGIGTCRKASKIGQLPISPAAPKARVCHSTPPCEVFSRHEARWMTGTIKEIRAGHCTHCSPLQVMIVLYLIPTCSMVILMYYNAYSRMFENDLNQMLLKVRGGLALLL